MEIKAKILWKGDREGSRLKGKAEVVVDGAIAIHNIKIIEGDKGLFIAMPSDPIKKKDIVHPINQEVRTLFEKEILDEFEKFEYTPVEKEEE